MTDKKPIKVYVRDFETRSVIKEVDVTSIVGTSNFRRFEMGILHNMNLDKYFLDESEVNKAEGGSHD